MGNAVPRTDLPEIVDRIGALPLLIGHLGAKTKEQLTPPLEGRLVRPLLTGRLSPMQVNIRVSSPGRLAIELGFNILTAPSVLHPCR